MDGFNWVALVVAVVGGGGVGVAVREIVGVVTLARQGVSGKEDKRKSDIIAARDHAIAMQAKAEAAADASDARADREAEHRRFWQEVAAVLRLKIITGGGDPGPQPVFNPEQGETT